MLPPPELLSGMISAHRRVIRLRPGLLLAGVGGSTDGYLADGSKHWDGGCAAAAAAAAAHLCRGAQGSRTGAPTRAT